MKIVFMGTPSLALPTLNKLSGSEHEILCAYTQPPRPAGRGQRLSPSPVQVRAEELGVCVKPVASLRCKSAQEEFYRLKSDIAVVVGYGLILPPEILKAPKFGCINIHVSLLPRWRGAAPVQRAIMAGDKETGVSIIQMDDGLDTGSVLMKQTWPIERGITAVELQTDLAELGSNLIIDALSGILLETISPTPQDHTKATYAKKLLRDEGLIDWALSASQIERNIRALYPRPGCWFEYSGERIRILSAKVVDGEGMAGKVIDNSLTIACGCDALRLEKVQRAGRKPLAGMDFLRGFHISPGTLLGVNN